jgi:hypothetical protein
MLQNVVISTTTSFHAVNPRQQSLLYTHYAYTVPRYLDNMDIKINTQHNLVGASVRASQSPLLLSHRCPHISFRSRDIHTCSRFIVSPKPECLHILRALIRIIKHYLYSDVIASALIHNHPLCHHSGLMLPHRKRQDMTTSSRLHQTLQTSQTLSHLCHQT